MHVGLEHIAFNTLMQLIVGLPLEMAEPGWEGTARLLKVFSCSMNSVHNVRPNLWIICRVMFVYTSGVVLGSLGGTLPNPHFS